MAPRRRAAPTVQVGMRMPPDLYEAIRDLSAARGQTITEYVIETLAARVKRDQRGFEGKALAA